MSTIALANTVAVNPPCETAARKRRFDRLAATHMDGLYRYAYWLSGNRAVADDLVQETLLRAWRSFDRLQETAAVKSWLLTILRRENARRFERKRVDIADLPLDAVADRQHDYDTSTEAFVLRRALARLPIEYRDPLLLQVIHGYSQKEIAEQLGISSAGAGTRLFRARQKLRELLGEDG
jgi:RNA polymerase sigma-70 factor (ECF subfamily)